ncbi:MAG: cytidine deaminase [Crocinitomicaceae bacterium]|nr:cytidine deaminase [Crocinitomicaceae bacterium]
MEKKISIEYIQLADWKELNDADQKLVIAAENVMKSAYAPYSKFSVGAALLLSSGEVITGSNQENIAYPSGLCAERVALFYAGSNYPNETVETLCVVAKGDLVDLDTILSPCGGCRQVMVETESRQGKPYRVIMISQNGSVIIFNSATELLPLAFGV